MNSDLLFTVKMRAAESGRHISGAEKITGLKSVPQTVSVLAERALSHSKGMPDFINLKIEKAGSIRRLKALSVTTNVTSNAEEGRRVAAELLAGAGITRIHEIMKRFSECHELRGAMLLDADTLERLEPDPVRGIRATYMDDADSAIKGTASGKNHYSEAIVLATKVQNAPGIVGEICVSDDPDYVTGYVATREIGYQRITVIKEKGDPAGGRIFLYRGPRSQIAETIRFLEKECVLVEDVPVLKSASGEQRFAGLERELESIEEQGLSRRCRVMEGAAGPEGLFEGRKVMVLASNDYLDLARNPRVSAAASEAALSFGAGTGGSRLTTGTQMPHVRLEEHISRFKGTESAILFNTGYMANLGVISALAGKGDVILSDELNHASIIDGCRLSRADVIVYRHLDMADMERKLLCCREYRRRIVVSDGIFSMDGDMLDLPRFLNICRENDAFSVVDEAHATGVAGATGRGLFEHFGCGHPDITVGTLSKALGAEGGFACGRKTVVDYLRNKARPFIFSTAMTAASVAAADAALSLLEEEPSRVAELKEKVSVFVGELNSQGVRTSTESAIVPIIIGDEKAAVRASEELLKEGYLISAIRYPTVARGSARLRAAIMATHSREKLIEAARAIASVCKSM